MNNIPQISVLMTAYNREKYISQSIDSVLKQTFPDFELIIVDDCSTDGTLQIAQHFANIDDRIRLFRNQSNLGQFKNRNFAAEQARSELLLFVDSDDTINYDTITHIYGLFQRFPEGSYLTINRDEYYQEEMVVSSYDFVRRHFFNFNNLSFGPGATAIKTSLFNRIGCFPISYGVAGDMFYNIKAASNSSVILCKNEFLNYRRHSGQEINNEFSYLVNGYLYFNDVMCLDELPLTSIERKFFVKKNKRRFVLNLTNFFFKTFDLKKSVAAVKSCKFSWADFVVSIFQI